MIHIEQWCQTDPVKGHVAAGPLLDQFDTTDIESVRSEATLQSYVSTVSVTKTTRRPTAFGFHRKE